MRMSPDQAAHRSSTAQPMTCPHCKMEVPDGASICGHCRKSLKPSIAGIGCGILGAFVVLLWAIVSQVASDSPSPSPQIPMVTYSLEGTARSASITIANESGGTEQHVVPVPWKKQFHATHGKFVYLSAQNQDSGRLEAEISVDGLVLQRAVTTEQYGIASVSGSVR